MKYVPLWNFKDIVLEYDKLLKITIYDLLAIYLIQIEIY